MLKRVWSTLQRPWRCLSMQEQEDELADSVISKPKTSKDKENNYGKTVRIATFNAALFSMAPAMPKIEEALVFDYEEGEHLRVNRGINLDSIDNDSDQQPKSILKQPSLHLNNSLPSPASKRSSFRKENLRVSINLPDNEISLQRQRNRYGYKNSGICSFQEGLRCGKSIFEVLKEVEADILALQEVKAAEENCMKPLSDLAEGLGMKYVFAESWAPEYGNAILSKWPIKCWKVQRILEDSDHRNVLKATIDVPQAGQVNIYCTHLDHLDEDWRMKQINAIMDSSDGPHILVGGLNSLDEVDYSKERWMDIVKYYENIGKPTPKANVMNLLKKKQYTDAKNSAGECESVVMIAKGQDVQGTSKYGTRVDYILSSPNSSYEFVPGSYSVISSKGTSDHHVVKVDVRIGTCENRTEQRQQQGSKHEMETVSRILSKSFH